MKYLNAVLTVIAVCLVMITCAVTGILPAAHAKETNARFVSVPVNADGSVNVKLVRGEVMDVNIEKIDGSSLYGSKLPVSTSGPLDVNIEKINDHSLYSSALPVKIEK